MRFSARRYDNGRPVSIEIDAGTIARIESTAGVDAARLPWVAPGFFDIQINGYLGQEFSSLELTAEKVATIARRHYEFGVTRMCSTLTTHGPDVFEHGLRQIVAACESSPELSRLIAGIHLEGPYLSREDGPRGAHPAEHCKPPDWDEFQRWQETAGGRIAIVTLSPEYENAPDFIARATAAGVVVAIGHTAADSDQIRAAVDAGARLSTHLGNGAHRELRRHPNYLWDQMADDRLMASLIVDGHHLPPEVVKTMVRAKTPERCILVSDESGLAGLPVGVYPSSGCDVEILADGRLVIAGQNQLLAGASLPIGAGVANVMHFAGVGMATAIEMASHHPARLLGRDVVALRPGDVADLVLFDLETNGRPALDVRATIAAGKLAFGALPEAV